MSTDLLKDVTDKLSTVDRDCRIIRMHMYGALPNRDECPRYDIKQSDSETPVMLQLRVTLNNLSLPLLPGSLWPRVIALYRILFMG